MSSRWGSSGIYAEVGGTDLRVREPQVFTELGFLVNYIITF